jgi:hypothetical protein
MREHPWTSGVELGKKECPLNQRLDAVGRPRIYFPPLHMLAQPDSGSERRTISPSSCNTLLPEYTRLPKSGTLDPLTGLSRSTLNALVLPTRANGFRPPVRSSVIKTNKHAKRGIRLVHAQSLLGFIAAQSAATDQITCSDASGREEPIAQTINSPKKAVPTKAPRDRSNKT